MKKISNSGPENIALSHDLKSITEGPKVQSQWLRTNDVIEYLNCSLSTLHKLRRSGILPHYTLGGVVYYNRYEIDLIILKNKVL